MDQSPIPPAAAPAVRLRRVLGLPALIVYGMVLIQPTAPMPLFGVASETAGGHVVTLILIGMAAMLLTAFSYGRMANAYPTAGSAYTYVGRELHPALGYLTGWSMMFDYVMNPLICTIWCGKASADLCRTFGILEWLRWMPLGAWFVLYAVLFTALSLRGIQARARTNYIIAGGLGVVILVFFAAALRHLLSGPALGAAELSRPFYDPATFSWSRLSGGAALAVLTYIGFDSISTLSEEAKDPRRNILRATVLVCLITGVLAAFEVYAAQLIWPDPASTFPSVENAFAHVAKRAGGENGQSLFAIVTVALLVATIGSGLGSQLGAGRLLYGMGRDNAIPKRFFGRLHPHTQVPANNIVLVGALALIGAFVLDWKEKGYDLGAQLLNFGALMGFMGVNLSSLVHYAIRGRDRRLRHIVPPILGFLICLYLWMSLSPTALWIGSIWLACGVLYGAWRTGFYRRPLQMFTGDDEAAGGASP